MMDMVTNRIIINSSRFFSLLFLFALICCSNTDKQSEINNAAHVKSTHPKIIINDSLEITVRNIPADKMASFFYKGINSKIEYIIFENNSKTTQSITKKIRKSTNFNLGLYYRTFTSINHKNISFYYDYFIDPSAHKMEFLFNGKTGDVTLQKHDGNVIKYDDISEEYQKINYKTERTTNLQKINKLESLHAEYRKNFSDEAHLLISDLAFYTQLSKVSPKDVRIKNYLENITNPIWGLDLNTLMYFYLEANKDNIYQLDLNKSKNEIYNRLIESGIAWHLQQFKTKDKKYPNYEKNLAWFKTTDYYHKNASELDKSFSVEKVDADALKRDLLSFNVHDGDKISTLKDVISKQESNYYLLDFWATWCVPCLQNMETIHKMELPKNLEVIYVSMDKTSDKEKWIKKSGSLHLSNSYLFVENPNNKNTIKNIKLNQLPRYIVVDKNYNILNFDFLSPRDADFLKELTTLIN